MKKLFLILLLTAASSVSFAQTSITGRVYSVRAFGAKGDNSTNDTAAFVAAVTAINASGGMLRIPAGTYLVDAGTVAITSNGITIEGDGPNVTILKSRTNTAGQIVLDTASSALHTVTIKDLTLEGFGSGASNNGITVSGANTPFNIRFSNIRILSFTGRGIYDTAGMFQSRLDNVVVSQAATGNNAIDVLGSNDLLIQNCYVTVTGNSTAAYRIHSGRPTLISNNGINPGSTSASWAVFGDNLAEDGADRYVFAVMIGNNLEDFTDNGVRFKAGSYGSFFGNSFIAPSSGTVTPLKFDFVDNGQRGIWDATNSIQTTGATYTNSNALNSRGAPFIQVGGNAFTSYYDTNITATITFPYITPQLVAGSSNIALIQTRAQITALESSGLVGDFTGSTSFAGDTARILLQDGTAARPTYTFSGDTNTGVYRAGADSIGLAANGAAVGSFGTTGLTLGVPGSVAGALIFGNSSNANTLTLQAGVTASSIAYTLPTADGSSGHCLKTNGSGVLSFSSCAGAPSLTATYVGYGDGSNLLTGTSDYTYATSTKTLSVINGSGNATLVLNGSAEGSKVQFNTGVAPGTQGGIVMPFAGGTHNSGQGIWWSDASNTSGLRLTNGLVWQGENSTHDPFKIAEGTGTTTDGTIRYTFAPSSSLFTQNLSTGVTTTTHDAMALDLISSGGAGGTNFGAGWLVRLENASSSLANATRLSVNWTTATGGSETARFVVANNTAGGGLADSFTVQGDQFYGTYYDQGNVSGAVTWDMNNGNFIKVTVTGNITSDTWNNLKAGARYVFMFQQNATGGWTWTPGTEFKYPGGISANVLTATIGAIDIFICDSDGTNLYCNGLFDVKNP